MNSIKKGYIKLKRIYQTKKLNYWLSILGSLIIGTMSIINTLMSFSSFTLYYAIFAFSLAIIKLISMFLKKVNMGNGILLYGSISLIFLSFPLVLSLIETILYKDKVEYIFFWIIYAYALYGTIKFVNAIIGLNKNKKLKNNYLKINSYFAFIGALYTIQMMEFSLIATFGEGEDLFILQMFTLGTIFAICILLSVKMFVEYVKNKKMKHIDTKL